MLQFNMTRIDRSNEHPVATGFTVDAEGQALVAATVGGTFGVKKSTGVAGEVFVGVAMAQQLTLLALPEVVEVTVDATRTAVLPHAPIVGTAGAFNVTASTAMTVAAAPGPTVVGLVGTTATFDASLVGKTIRVQYRFVPTTVEAQSIQGHIPAGGAAALVLGQVGVAQAGEIYTTEFDTAADWTVVSPITLGANGLFTKGGTGAVVANGYVVQVPTADNPVLGLSFSV